MLQQQDGKEEEERQRGELMGRQEGISPITPLPQSRKSEPKQCGVWRKKIVAATVSPLVRVKKAHSWKLFWEDMDVSGNKTVHGITGSFFPTFPLTLTGSQIIGLVSEIATHAVRL